MSRSINKLKCGPLNKMQIFKKKNIRQIMHNLNLFLSYKQIFQSHNKHFTILYLYYKCKQYNS